MDCFCCVVDESFLDQYLEEGHGDIFVEVVDLLVFIGFFEVEDCAAFHAILCLWRVEFLAVWA